MKFTILALFLLSSSLLEAATVNYKNKYCQKKEFVTSKKQTPHLHCDKNFILLKHKRGGDHYEYFAKENIIRCAKLFKVLEDPNGFGAFYRFAEIEKSMMDFAENECNRSEEEKEQFESALVEYNKAKAASINKKNNQNKKYSKPRTQVGKFKNKQNENIDKDTKQEKDQEKEDQGPENNQQCDAL